MLRLPGAEWDRTRCIVHGLSAVPRRCPVGQRCKADLCWCQHKHVAWLRQDGLVVEDKSRKCWKMLVYLLWSRIYPKRYMAKSLLSYYRYIYSSSSICKYPSFYDIYIYTYVWLLAGLGPLFISLSSLSKWCCGTFADGCGCNMQSVNCQIKCKSISMLRLQAQQLQSTSA